MQRNIALGILAHVDAGKTTLTESILLLSGTIRRAGRVDHRDTYLDTDRQERQRGITIYDKNAMFSWRAARFTVIDTPGHTDFAAETERAIGVLDAAILLVSAPDSVQSHTRTLWRLLEIYGVPTIIFVNKMDMPDCDRQRLLRDIKSKLSPLCAEVGSEEFTDISAESDEDALNIYIESGELPEGCIKKAFNNRKLFPVVFGSALKHEGTEALLNCIYDCAQSHTGEGELLAKIYKISHDPKGEKLAFVKVISGEIKVRMPLSNLRGEGEEKISGIRFYSGDKYTVAQTAPAGSICALTGLKSVLAGDSLGAMSEKVAPIIEPVFTYRAALPEDCDASEALRCFRILEEEDPQLRVKWIEHAQQINISVMGDVALEILTETLKTRFALNVSFDSGSVVYRETISAPVEGAGHYEPLRHYAEVHLRLEPADRGSGISIASEVSTDELALNWQRLIFTHIAEKAHAGVLTGSALTDVKIVLTGGRAHIKHTEGGDFRQATYRAIRQALMKAQFEAKNILLEPMFEMRVSVPDECLGRLMNDLTLMGGTFEAPVSMDGFSEIRARVPVRNANGYQRQLAAYSKGRGGMSLTPAGYEICKDQDNIVSQINYDAERDTDNPADSVFCSHGAGVNVNWREADAHMHVKLDETRDDVPVEPTSRPRSISGDLDLELKQIFERTYGKKQPMLWDRSVSTRKPLSTEPSKVIDIPKRPEYLLVDGYNVIFAWPELKAAAKDDLENGRRLLSDILDNFASQRDEHVILVFDAYKVRQNPGTSEKYGNIEIVYTKEAQTADSYIEKLTYELSKHNRVRVATSDGMEQLIILGSGALRVSANEFRDEIQLSEKQMRQYMERLSARPIGVNIGNALNRALNNEAHT